MMSRRESVKIDTREDVVKIPDLKTAVMVMKEMKIDTKGIQNTQQAIHRILDHMDQHPGTKPKKPDKPAVYTGLKKAVEDDKEKRNKLVQKYHQTEQFYSELPKHYKKDLNQFFQGVENAFKEREADLEKNECAILIAGETASGKSSLVNLLLGVDLFPTSALGATEVICEIRKSSGEKKEAIAYYKGESQDGKKVRKQAPVVMDLSNKNGLDQLKRIIAFSDKKSDDDDSPFDRVEVFWPFDMLEEGIVIVDTPGFGSGPEMKEIVEKYGSKSFGFIYVINSTAAGGVAKDRLQTFLRLVINTAGEEFTPDSTIFIANKWEHIPEHNKEDLKRDIETKLGKIYEGLKLDQIYYMSVLEAQRDSNLNVTSVQYGELARGLEKLLPESLRSRLTAHYRWLAAVLKRSMYSLKVSKVMAAKSKEEKQERFEQIRNQIDKLERDAERNIFEMKKSMEFEADQLSKKVLEALRSKELTDKLFTWDSRDCPATKDKKKFFKEAMEKIEAKVTSEVNAWEKRNEIMHGIKHKIVKAIKRDFEFMEDQMAKIEAALADGDTHIANGLQKSIKKQAPVKQLWKKAKDDGDKVKGLGGATCSSASLSSSTKTVKGLVKSVDQGNAVAKMAELTSMFVSSIFESSSGLTQSLKKYFEKYLKGIDTIAKMIPGIVKADKELMDILQQEIKDTSENLKDLYPNLLRSCNTLQGSLDSFYVNNIWKWDYSVDDLVWDPSESPIGSGSFADVYLATLKHKGSKVKVALKVCRDPMKDSTISDILLEDGSFRALEHKNVVTYYGSTYRFKNKKQQRDPQWVMIMEMCKSTLKTRFIGSDVPNPGKFAKDSKDQITAMKTMAQFAEQIAEGLVYLHGKGFVHRDLKLENILVSDNDVVKLTDLGLAKPKMDIAGSIVGSPVYMAPEVLLQKQFNYDDKADIYSLAIVLWEMWYGIDAADHIQEHLFGPLESAVKGGLRPSLSLNTKLPEEWMKLIKDSWEYDHDKRPPATVHLKHFRHFLQTH